MNITVRIAYSYGNKRIYPVCDTAKKLAQLANTKTFTQAQLIDIQALGYTISVEPQTL